MMNELGGILGLAQRAGQLVSGRDAVKEAIMANKACLLLLTDDAGASLVKEMNYLALDYDIKLIISGTKAELGSFLGKRNRSVAAVLNQGFADIIIKKFTIIRDGEATM